MGSNDSELIVDLFLWLKEYKDGTIKRITGFKVVPPGLDPETNVLSKDIVIIPESDVSARIYRPNFVPNDQKLPLAASPRAPSSYSIYKDSWASLQWVASHKEEEDGNNETWIKNYVDLDQVYLVGDSTGANIAHHLALRIKDSDLKVVDKWWLYVCPFDKGYDDPLINPFVDGSPDLAGLACHRILVIVAEKDIFKDMGRFYYDKLVKSEWKGKSEIMETEGEGHVFYIFNPEFDKAKSLFKRLAAFLNQGK
ncbi:Mov34/MPN/PAD-1 family protein [Hibiscus syriacus]|uniref:Mov34/MPN/PAD-1 family protein n=1 Tax=Hibiscus syriacus TaxID=106335 RepID=A0A6A3BI05_HIBSY|nr:Mov34/MPN/PAD-1 family protein [Hibiscus syriacus]